MRAVAIAVLLATGCAEAAGPLDRSTIAEIARSRGDAQGSEHAGTWHAMLDVGECDCPTDAGTAACLSEDIAELVGVTMEIVEGDGFMLVRIDVLPQLELSGAIDADGTMSLGSVYVGLDLDSSLVLLGRFDGEFDGSGGLTGVVSLRAEGELAGTPVSCGADAEIEATEL
jgi:hypothetical protein